MFCLQGGQRVCEPEEAGHGDQDPAGQRSPVLQTDRTVA